MSWLFSQALVAEFSQATSWAGAPSAPLSVMPTQHKFWRSGKTMDASRLSRFGLTCAVLTEDRGAALLTWFLADSRVRTYQLPGMVPESTAPGLGSGVKWRESSVRFDRVSSSWRTHHCLWDEALPWSSVILPRWGMTCSGVVFQHPIAERPISATASGLWRTPMATDAQHPGRTTKKPGQQLSLPAQVNSPHLWPTPTVYGNHNRPYPGKQSGFGLSTAAKLWPTPTRSDAMGGPGHQGRKGGENLRTAIRSWPTPVATMSKGSSPAALTRKNGKSRENDRLDHAVMASDSGQLNPTWVEWLMGWPIGWTDLKPLEMGRFHEWQQQHSTYSTTFEAQAA